jgi:hypothetical protein
VQITERYLGCKQNLGSPVNDRFAAMLSASPPARAQAPATAGPAGDDSLYTDLEHRGCKTACFSQIPLDLAYKEVLSGEG